MIKTVHDLPDDWQSTTMRLYKVGASDTEVRAELNMTYKLWQKLMHTDPSFEDIILHGRTLAKAWWLTQGRVNLTEREFNAALYKINMQNRFNWNDKTATVDEDPEDYEDEETINERLAAILSDTDDSRPN